MFSLDLTVMVYIHLSHTTHWCTQTAHNSWG